MQKRKNFLVREWDKNESVRFQSVLFRTHGLLYVYQSIHKEPDNSNRPSNNALRT